MDSSKFFNRKLNIRDPKKPYQKGKVVEESANYKSRVFSRVKENPTTKSLISIRRKVISIENTLKSIFNLNKKSDQSKQRFILLAAQEKKSKKKISAPNLNLGNIIERPKTGAMDFISNFLTFTFLGWLFTRLQPLIGKLEGLLPIIEGAFDFLGGTVKFLIDGLGSFIKFGYDAYDGIKGAKKGIEDQTANIQKTFDDTTKALGDLIDGTVKVATSFLDLFKEPYDKISQTQDGKDAVNLNFASLTSISTLTATSFASGGRIDPSKPITRGVEQERKSIKPKPVVQAQKTTPGKDVGGESKVKEIYGENGGMFKFDFAPLPSFFRKDKKSGYTALVSTSEEYKKQRSEDILGIGNLMGASVDTALGQKPDRKTYSQFADGIKYLVDYGMTNPEEFSKINLEEMIRRIVEPKVEQAIMKIREEVNKKSSTGAPDGVPDVELTGGEFDEASIEGVNEMDLFKRLVYSEAGGEGLLGMALVARSVLNRTGLIQSGKASPGTYLAEGRSLTNIIMAPRQYTPISNGKINQKLSKSQLDQAMQAIELAKDPNKLIEKLRQEKIPESQITLLMASTGFRNYAAGAGHDPSQKVNEINFKRHTFNTAGNTSLLVPRGVSIDLGISSKMSSNYLTNLNTGLPGFTLEGQKYRASRDDGKRLHAGRDVDLPPNGIFYSRLGGEVIFAGNVGGGYGNVVDIYNRELNRTERIAEGTTILSGVKKGAIISPGQPVVSGTHQTGVIHYEIRKGKAGPSGSVENTEDPDAFLNSSSYVQYISKIKSSKAISEPKEKLNLPETTISQQPRPTPPKASEAYMINEKMYYVDTKGQGKVTDQNGAVIDFSGDKNKWLLKEIQTRRQIQKKKYGGLVYSNASRPVLPAEKYASYNDPMMSTQLVIQPIIVQNVVPVQDSKQTIIFAPPRVNSTGKSKKLMRN